jgi:serine/threonine protein kinase
MNGETRYLGKYQLIECIARGGMGEVWKALDSQLKREVAIKLLRPHIQKMPDFIMHFEQEARVIASLHHPNIIEIHDFKIDNGYLSSPPASDPPLCYMVMDYVQGETLAHYIYNFTLRNTSRCGPFPPIMDIVHIFTVVGLALDYAHQRGVIHRDIKPANILLDQRIPTVRPMGEPILTDFGIARQYGATRDTIAGCIIGTPKYMAPEQAQGRYDDPRSDLYSLGIILYEMMTGVTPFHADTPLAIVMQHLHEKPISPDSINPHIPAALAKVILKSIAKDPDARFSTATDLAVALTEAFNIPTPEHPIVGSSGCMPSGRSHSGLPLTYEPPSYPSNSIQTPFTGLPPAQSMFSPSPSSDQSLKDVSGFSRYRDSIIPRNAPADMKKSPARIIPYRLAETPSGTPSHIDISGSVNVTPHESELGDKTKQSRFNNKKWMVGLASLLVLVLLGSGLGIQLLFWPTSHNGEAVIGHVRFVKNGPSHNYNALQIDIGQVPRLPQGMAYYAWIKLGGEETIPNWQLTVSQQAIHTPLLKFPGVDNLYVPHRLFLITKERIDSSPNTPNPAAEAHLYYAIINPNLAAILDLKQCDGSSACS